MVIRRCLLLLLPFTLLLQPADGSTEVGDRLDGSTTWMGRVVVSAPVTVASDTTLTIRPGTRVIFGKGAGLVVEGRILALGEESQEIRFEPDDGLAPGDWSGVVIAPLQATTAASRMIGCWVSGASIGIMLKSEAASSHRVADCRVIACPDAGIVLNGVSGALIQDNQVRQCGTAAGALCGGILLKEASYCTVSGNSVHDCRRFGILLSRGRVNTVRRNTVRAIGGKSQSTEGMGICIESGSSRNLVLSNRVNHCNYNGIVIYSRDNQVIDNDIGESPDCLGLAGPDCQGNIVRDNRTHGVGGRPCTSLPRPVTMCCTTTSSTVETAASRPAPPDRTCGRTVGFTTETARGRWR